MDPARAEKLAAELNRLGATKPCPRCGHPHFQIVAETSIQIQEQPGAFVIGGPVIPVVVVGCKKCGYLTEHSLGILNMMPEAAHA